MKKENEITIRKKGDFSLPRTTFKLVFNDRTFFGKFRAKNKRKNICFCGNLKHFLCFFLLRLFFVEVFCVGLNLNNFFNVESLKLSFFCKQPKDHNFYQSSWFFSRIINQFSPSASCSFFHGKCGLMECSNYNYSWLHNFIRDGFIRNSNFLERRKVWACLAIKRNVDARQWKMPNDWQLNLSWDAHESMFASKKS